MPSTNPLVSKLLQMLPLSADDQLSIAEVPIRHATIARDQDVVRRGDRPTRSVMVIEGMLATSKIGSTGTRQIVALHVPNDIPDLMTLNLDLMDSDLRTVSETEVGFIEHSALRALCQASPTAAAALWKVTLVDAAILREWIVNVGERPGLARMSHLFCEMMTRMGAAGKVDNGTCSLSLSQTYLAEVTGMSSVHVNRILQQLRARRLITFNDRTLTIHDRNALEDLADFTPDYLHMDRQPEFERFN